MAFVKMHRGHVLVWSGEDRGEGRPELVPLNEASERHRVTQEEMEARATAAKAPAPPPVKPPAKPRKKRRSPEAPTDLEVKAPEPKARR